MKRAAPLREEQAVDGKLKSHLVWPKERPSSPLTTGMLSQSDNKLIDHTTPKAKASQSTHSTYWSSPPPSEL